MAGLAAIQYGPDGFDTNVRMMGRQRAGEGMLRAWIAHSGADPLTGWTQTEEHARSFAEHSRKLGYRGVITTANAGNGAALAAAGALWLADPNLPQYAWLRRWGSQTACSIVGITHTISSHAAMDMIAQTLTAPVQRWDALICTSRAAKSTVTAILDAEADYLAARIGARQIAGPELPVIPLGVDCDAFAPDPVARARWRAELNITADEVVVLQFGRIAMHFKSHPVAVFEALAQAARRGDAKLRFVIAGQFINPRQDEMHRALASRYASLFRTDFVDGSRADADSIRAAADIFTLMSDNIQESFGLAPIEAMAAGLPVVATDWDGLRDTIEHGVTGFRIDTFTPPIGAGEAIARRHALMLDPPEMFLSATTQATLFDIGQAADAFHTLAVDPALRHTMGEAGRARASAIYDWRVIIRAYLELLEYLAERRREGVGERAPRARGTPGRASRMDPFRAFAGHPTGRLNPEMCLDRAPGAPALVADIPGGLAMSYLHAPSLPPHATLDAMIAAVGGGPIRIGDLLPLFTDIDQARLYCGIGWLMKFGFLRRV